jgi:transposase
MLSLPPAVRVFLSAAAVDGRLGIDGLAALVRDAFGLDPLSGHLFVFRNRRGDRARVLYWDRSGFWLLQKRLERGVFRFPSSAEARVEVEAAELALLLEGIKAWLDRERTIVLPKSPIGVAIQYALNQWKALNRYLEDGALAIDNNRSERGLRRVAVGRNYADIAVMRTAA